MTPRSNFLILISSFFLYAGCVTSLPFGNVATLFQCKKIEEKPDPIVGGSAVAYGDPDQNLVVMLNMRRTDRESVCTGTVISDQVILTAAHCVEGVAPGDIQAHFQTSSGCPVNQARNMIIGIEKSVIHKKFDGTPQSLSDLALLYLEEKAPTDQERLPILEKNEKLTSDQVLLIGFGITAETKKDSQILRRINKSFEKDISPRGRALLVDQRKSGGGFCRGDSGAPIIGEIWGEPHIVGVNSANVGIEAGTECQTLSIALSAPEFSGWIHRNQKKLDSSTWISRLFSKSSVRTD